VVEHVLYLQRTVGNQSTLDLLTGRDVTGGLPERPLPEVSQSTGASEPFATVEPGDRGDHHKHAARVTAGTAAAPRGAAGAPLDAATRSMFEARFGDDFSDVTIHTGAAAAQSASALAARAYTAGESIVFNHGAYAPQHPSGQHPVSPRARPCGAAAPRSRGSAECR
jgi:hypothetical protein